MSTKQLTLLGIFAHPDDESFGTGGTLSRYAREGVDVHVCIVTDGAAGSCDESMLAGYSSLAERRVGELACAAKTLGVTLHTLGYRDSGMEGSPDNKHAGCLYQADLDEVARDLVRLVREVQPEVILTHDPTGGYFHPDHIRVNHAVTRAFARAADPAAYPTLLAEGYEPWQPQRLYYTAMPRTLIRWGVRILRLLRKDPTRVGRNGDIDLTRLGVPDEQIHVRLRIGPYLAIKEAASACHTSQGGRSAIFRWLPAVVRQRLFGFETFTQAYPPNPTSHDDLFAGIRPGRAEPSPEVTR
ncbi:MAG: PIG-L family deacetylase [Ardenticatenaceae bacterium]|nr:PIG-L family deacetylase [Ardenticatenaceae bacterium]HBY99641.1 GlcNAc-PI de-N-acetylase [Chloroflexota bacterium]